MTRPHEDVIREALGLHGTMLASGECPSPTSERMFHEALDALAALVDERNRLREALRLTEWQWNDAAGRPVCYVCDATENEGHHDDCPVALALAASPGDKTPEASGPDEQEAGT